MVGSYFWGSGMDSLVGVIFVVVMSIVVYLLARGLVDWKNNDGAPRLAVDAKVVAKRTRRPGRGSAGMDRVPGVNGYISVPLMDYYVTFGLDSGDEMELLVPVEDYDLIAEEDRGKLRFRGDTFLDFVKEEPRRR